MSKEIKDLTETVVMADDDLIQVQINVAGTFRDRKIKKSKLRIALGVADADGNVYIGTYARLHPIANGFMYQLSTDGITWQDGESQTAT